MIRIHYNRKVEVEEGKKEYRTKPGCKGAIAWIRCSYTEYYEMHSWFLAVYSSVELEHFLVIRVQRKGSSAVSKSTGDIPNVLMESSTKVQEVKVSFECYRLCQLCNCLFLLVVIHKHCL